MSRLGAYLAFVRASFYKMLAYRLRYVTGILSYLIYVTTYYFLWRSVYAGRGGGQLGGFDLGGLVTYVAIGWMARSFYFNNIDQEIATLVTEGQIASTLARPVSFQGQMVASAFGESLFRLLFFSVPIGVVLFALFPVGLPASPGHAAAYLLSSLLALLIFVHLNFLVGLSALHLKSIQGVMRAKHYLIELLSGLLLPPTFFPGWLQAVTRWLPFQAISFLPSSIYLGRVHGRELSEALAVQLFWVLLLTGMSALLWRRMAARLTVQGG